MLYVYPITFFILCLSHYQCEPARSRFVPPSSGGSVAGAARRSLAVGAGAGVLTRSSSPPQLKEPDELFRISLLRNKREQSSHGDTREAIKISKVMHEIYKITSELPAVKHDGTERRDNSAILLRQFRGGTRTKFHRFKRESNTFISPFAFSKHFKSSQNKSKTTNKTTGPNASLLRSIVDVKYSKYDTNLYAGLTTVAVNNTTNILDREVASNNISTILSHFNESRPNKIVFLNCQGYSNLTECRLRQKNYRQNRLNATEEPPRSLNKNGDNNNVSKVIHQTLEDVSNKEVKYSKNITKYYSTTTIVDNVTPKSLVMDGKVVGFDSYHGKARALPYATKENIVAFNDSEGSWPIKHAAIVEGDLILGGLMMVHSREDSVTCGPVMPQGGVQALEAMLYTLDVINTNKLLPGVTLGAHVLDDCDKDTYGLEMAVDFIKGSISNIDDAEYACNRSAVRKVISGVVGAASSVTSIQVANLLRLFKIPQVSFFSTSPELSNKARFEYFTRTIPSDHHQVKAMVEIVKTLGWSYVSIVYEESNYGIKAYEELEALLARHDICIAVKEKLVKDSGVADEGAYDDIVVKLLTKPRARGAIIFGSDQEVAGVMRAVQRCNATGAFSWVGSDGWSARALVSDGNERAVEGTISVQPQANDVHGFRDYFLGLSVDNNKRNPWFIEFWEDHFQCRYPNSARTPYNTDYTRACTGKEQLTSNNTDFENQLQFVSDAVMAFAYAIRDMHADVCGGRPGLCDAMRPTSGPDLLRYLRRVHFTGLTGDEFRFDGNGDGPARYNILHFKQVTPGNYRWLKVGEYLDGELKLNLRDIQFKWNERRPPESVCSAECELGQAKQYVEGESCCWHCFNCTQYEIRSPYVETACIECARGTLPNVNRTYCRPIPEVFLRPNSGWAIGAMSLSSIGILLTSFVCGVFVRHHETPVVRASGRELSYVLLAGILMCYLVTFALVFRPTDYLCSLQRFGTGFCFTVVYAALLTKTNRISRIFNASKHSAKRPSLISPHSQLAICFALVSVQVMIVVVWMVVAPAHAMYHYPTREDNMLVCDSYIDASYMIAFFYPILLILVCTVYAVLTRKIPEAFNESKHIGFTMYTTCVIWLAFVPLYFGTASHVPLRITSMSVTISLSASVTLVCLFSPKLYIILIRPERNVRQSMMPARYSVARKSHGPRSGVMAAAIVGAVTCDQDQINDNLRPQTKTFSTKYAQTEDTINSEKPVVPDAMDVVVNGTDEVNNVFAQDQINHSEIVKHENNGNDIVPFDVRNVKCKDCPDRVNDDQNKIVLKENGIACIAITTTEVAL